MSQTKLSKKTLEIIDTIESLCDYKPIGFTLTHRTGTQQSGMLSHSQFEVICMYVTFTQWCERDKSAC